MAVLTRAEIEEFVEYGFVRVPGAVPADVAERCRTELWQATGCDPDDPAAWTEPVIRRGGFA
ncbi:phytanoyl-CoA dioxygenase, partial [Marinitenerispora sediminis]